MSTDSFIVQCKSFFLFNARLHIHRRLFSVCKKKSIAVPPSYRTAVPIADCLESSGLYKCRHKIFLCGIDSFDTLSLKSLTSFIRADKWNHYSKRRNVPCGAITTSHEITITGREVWKANWRHTCRDTPILP